MAYKQTARQLSLTEAKTVERLNTLKSGLEFALEELDKVVTLLALRCLRCTTVLAFHPNQLCKQCELKRRQQDFEGGA